MQEGINIKHRGEIEDIIDLLRREGDLIIDYSIYLEEEGLWRLLDPTMFLHADHLTLLIPVIIYMRNGDLLTGLVEVLVLYVDEQQTEQLLLRFVDLCNG